MPNCVICGKETPVTRFYLVRGYGNFRGWWLYFCSKAHLIRWATNGAPDAYDFNAFEPDPSLREVMDA